jgi:hypothetical protein
MPGEEFAVRGSWLVGDPALRWLIFDEMSCFPRQDRQTLSKRLDFLGPRVAQLCCNLQQRVEFVQGTKGNLDKPRNVAGPLSSCALRDIGGNRNGCSARLARQSVQFFARPPAGQAIYILDGTNREPPNFKTRDAPACHVNRCLQRREVLHNTARHGPRTPYHEHLTN